MSTCGIDGVVKVWDTGNIGVGDSGSGGRSKKSTSGSGSASASASSGDPVCVAYKSMSVGKLFSLEYYPDSPFLLGVGGDEGVVALWESDEYMWY
jgi:hypothetical protein